MKRTGVAAACLIAVAVASPSTAEVHCVGDCNGNGLVTVDELIVGVTIALGSRALEECGGFDSSGDGSLSVSELVRAVADALFGCGVTPPTPLPTGTQTATIPPSATPTMPPTATPSPTSGMPDVSGTWREEQLTVSSSTCRSDLTSAIAEALRAEPPCDHAVSQNGGTVQIVDCNGISAAGTVDQAGTIRLELPPEQATDRGCTVTARTRVTIEAGQSPTRAQYDLTLSFSGTCSSLPPCGLEIRGTWTRRQ